MKFSLKRLIVFSVVAALMISFLVPFGWTSFDIKTEKSREHESECLVIVNRSTMPVWYRIDYIKEKPIVCSRDRESREVLVGSSRTIEWKLLDIGQEVKIANHSPSHDFGILISDWLGREKVLFE